MTRAQRKRHRVAWMILGPALVALIVVAIVSRPSSRVHGGASVVPRQSAEVAR